MRLMLLEEELSVCKLREGAPSAPGTGFYCLCCTAAERSLVCPSREAPPDALAREDGWRALGVAGPLDFSLVGVLAELSGRLARAGVSIFAVSTFDTDYLLVKERDLSRALEALRAAGHEIA